MPIMLGNRDVSNIEKRLGITLKENDRETLISMRQNNAQDIQIGKWPCFDIPLMIMCGDCKTGPVVCEVLRR